MLSFLTTSSSSKSVMVLPSSTLRWRSVAPAVNSIAEASDVFPLCPCPIKATFRMSELSKIFITPRAYQIRLARRTFRDVAIWLNALGDLLRGRHVARYIDYRVVGENPAAALTKHDLVLAPQILKELRAQRNMAGAAPSVGCIGDGRILRFF